MIIMSDDRSTQRAPSPSQPIPDAAARDEQDNVKEQATPKRRRSSVQLTTVQKLDLEEKLAALGKKHDVWQGP